MAAASVHNKKALYRTQTLFSVDMHPSTVTNVLEGVYQQLNINLLRYVDEFEGVMLAYSNVKILTDKPVIHPYFPFFHLDVMADVLLFKPAQGMTLLGRVNHLGEDYISALVLGVFNATIPARSVHPDLHFFREEDKWMHKQDSKHVIVDGSYVVFTVEEVRDHGGFFQITGSLMDPAVTGTADYLYPDVKVPEAAAEAVDNLTAMDEDYPVLPIPNADDSFEFRPSAHKAATHLGTTAAAAAPIAVTPVVANGVPASEGGRKGDKASKKRTRTPETPATGKPGKKRKGENGAGIAEGALPLTPVTAEKPETSGRAAAGASEKKDKSKSERKKEKEKSTKEKEKEAEKSARKKEKEAYKSAKKEEVDKNVEKEEAADKSSKKEVEKSAKKKEKEVEISAKKEKEVDKSAIKEEAEKSAKKKDKVKDELKSAKKDKDGDKQEGDKSVKKKDKQDGKSDRRKSTKPSDGGTNGTAATTFVTPASTPTPVKASTPAIASANGTAPRGHDGTPAVANGGAGHSAPRTAGAGKGEDATMGNGTEAKRDAPTENGIGSNKKAKESTIKKERRKDGEEVKEEGKKEKKKKEKAGKE